MYPKWEEKIFAKMNGFYMSEKFKDKREQDFKE